VLPLPQDIYDKITLVLTLNLG